MVLLNARFVSLHDALAVPKSERGCDSALTPRVTPFPALELGPLLGRGSYGRVYRGKHLGRPVAVKVRDPLRACVNLPDQDRIRASAFNARKCVGRLFATLAVCEGPAGGSKDKQMVTTGLLWTCK